MDDEDFERACELRREENEQHLDVFEKYLVEAGLSDKTIDKHIGNVAFYLNTYLLREDAASMAEGCYRMPLTAAREA